MHGNTYHQTGEGGYWIERASLPGPPKPFLASSTYKNEMLNAQKEMERAMSKTDGLSITTCCYSAGVRRSTSGAASMRDVRSAPAATTTSMGDTIGYKTCYSSMVLKDPLTGGGVAAGAPRMPSQKPSQRARVGTPCNLGCFSCILPRRTSCAICLPCHSLPRCPSRLGVNWPRSTHTCLAALMAGSMPPAVHLPHSHPIIPMPTEEPSPCTNLQGSTARIQKLRDCFRGSSAVCSSTWLSQVLPHSMPSGLQKTTMYRNNFGCYGEEPLTKMAIGKEDMTLSASTNDINKVRRSWASLDLVALHLKGLPPCPVPLRHLLLSLLSGNKPDHPSHPGLRRLHTGIGKSAEGKRSNRRRWGHLDRLGVGLIFCLALLFWSPGS